MGPINPFGKPSLLLVTQGHVVQIVHRLSNSLPFQLVSASLRHASHAIVTDRPVVGETTNGPGGLIVCVKAAMGLAYGGVHSKCSNVAFELILTVLCAESSIIIATCSTLIPPASSTPDFPDHFGAPVPPASVSPSGNSWENFGSDPTIHLCEVKITAYNFAMGLFATLTLSRTIVFSYILGIRYSNEATATSIPSYHLVITSH